MATDGLPPLMALATLDDGHAEWYFNEYATLQRLVEDILPSDVSQRKATALVRDCCPDLDFTSRDVRTCIAATRVKEPVLSTEPVMLPGIDAKAFADKFLIRHTTLAGFGAFANRDIKRGERILAEEPLIECTIPKSGDCDLTAIIGTLSEGKQEAYYALSQAPLYGETKTNVGIWHSNAYPQASPLAMAFDLQNGVGRDKEGACFAVACRFNHSCVPNVHCAWNGRLKRQTIHALRDIAKGEELVVNYLAELAMPTEARRRRLREGFGFECMCAACTLVADAQQASDRRRARIRELAVMIRTAVNGDERGSATPGLPRARSNALALVDERLGLLAAEGLEFIHDTLYAACAYCRSVGDKTAASAWASRAAESARLALGKDSLEFNKYASFIGTRRAARGK